MCISLAKPDMDRRGSEASSEVAAHLAQEEVDPWPLVDMINDAPAVKHDLDDPDFEARGTESTRIAADARHCTVAGGDAHAARGMNERFVEIQDEKLWPAERTLSDRHGGL